MSQRRGRAGDDLPGIEILTSAVSGAPIPPASPRRPTLRRGVGSGAVVVAVVVVIGVAVVAAAAILSGHDRADSPVVEPAADRGASASPEMVTFSGDPVVDAGTRTTIGVVGESCCDRPVSVVAVGLAQLFAGRPRSNAPDVAGIPGVTVYGGVDGRQLAAIAVGDATIVVAAEPSRPFTPAELTSLRDLLSVTVGADGITRAEAVPPLVAGATSGLRRSPGSLRHERVTVVSGAAASGSIVAVDRWTGRLLWEETVGQTAYLVDLADDTVVASPGPGRLVVLDVYTGRVRWTGSSVPADASSPA